MLDYLYVGTEKESREITYTVTFFKELIYAAL